MVSILRAFLSLGLRTFFRRVEVTGLENIPVDRGGILIAWHPNGLVDPALMYTFFPRRLVFGARHGLFRWPILGWMMRQLGTVPIYRGQDLKGMDITEQRRLNQQSLDALADQIVSGSYSALFPEGVSHDDPFIQQLKTGAARIYCAARQGGPEERTPVIIPVGLHYDCKHRFRSSVLIHFHPPLNPPSEIFEQADDQAMWRDLTTHMEQALQRVVFATESWEMHRNLHRATTLIRAERLANQSKVTAAPIDEQVIGLARLWMGYHARLQEDPEKVAFLVNAVAEYRLDMEALGLMDHQLDGDVRWISRRAIAILLMQTVFYLLVLPPVLLVGYVVNFPTTALIRVFAKRYSALNKDQASVQLFSSLIGYPLTWLVWAGLAYWGHLEASPIFPNLPDVPIASAIFVLSLSMVSCVVMFVYLRSVKRMFRAWKVHWTKKRHQWYIQDLLDRRQWLAEALIEFAEGLDLPGVVGDDNRLKWDA